MRARVVQFLPTALWLVAVAGLAATVLTPGHGVGTSEELSEPIMIVFLLFVLSFVTVGALVASKRPGNPLGWIMLTSGLAYVVGGINTAWLEGVVTPATEGSALARYGSWVSSWVWGFGPFLSATFLLLLFPDGHLPSRRWRHLARAIALAMVLFFVGVAFRPGPIDVPIDVDNPLGVGSSPTPFEIVATVGGVTLFAGALLSIVSLFVRYRRAHATERTQLKWIAFAGGAVALLASAGILVETIGGTEASVEISNILVSVALTTIPVAMGIAILRHRLFDIDRIINRTLVYSLVSLLPASAYSLAVLVPSWLGRGVEDSSLAVAASTLAIVALFRPVRRRVQDVVDRRFYRSRYDAQLTAERFARRLREQTELNALIRDLVAVVEGALQPAHVTMWLRPPTPQERPHG